MRRNRFPMGTGIVLLLGIGIVFGGGLVSTVVAQEKTQPEKISPEMEAYVSEYMKTIKLTEHHKHLSRFIGTWNAEVKSWVAPNKPPVTSKGSAVVKSIYGGRYTMMTFKGFFAGMPFEGLNISTYNTLKKEYEALWVDSMSSWLYVARGHCDGTGRRTEYRGTYRDPVSRETVKVREVFESLDQDTFRMEYFETHGDQEVKIMEITYHRVKD